MTQHIFEGAIVNVQGYEFVASDVVWSGEDEEDGPTVRFTGTCTEDPRNDSIRNTCYNGGRYGGNRLAGYRRPAS
jgi:hypothetical protein